MAHPNDSDRRLIPNSYLDELNHRADIEALIGERVPLKKAGASLVACCPFHSEKSPSFTVSATKGFYHCFGCGANGKALSFLIEYDGMPFRDAVRELAQRCGMQLPAEMMPTTAGGAAVAPTPDHTPLYEANATAYHWLRKTLRTDEGAKSYLKGRGMTSDTLRRFLIGSAPDEWQGLAQAFPDYETNDAIVACGLTKVNEDSGRKYDLFRNRVMFGIRDPRGRIIGFGGRVMDDSKPKYINSPESPIFDKSSVLFGLFEAREDIRREKFALVAEGYMDVVMMAQFGILNAVAGMGTAFTRTQAERLLTQTKSIIFTFDGDNAGQAAAMKACATMLPLIEEEHDVRVLILPDGMDPDEMVRDRGPTELLARARSAPTLLTHILATLAARHDIQSPEGRARVLQEGQALFNTIQRPSLRGIYQKELSVFCGLSQASTAAATQQRARRAEPTLWERLAQAARQAPAMACSVRDEILECLDPQRPEEEALAHTLQAAMHDDQAEGEPHEQIIATDLLSNALQLIVDLREKQFKADIRRQYENQEISLETYMHLATSQQA